MRYVICMQIIVNDLLPGWLAPRAPNPYIKPCIMGLPYHLKNINPMPAQDLQVHVPASGSVRIPQEPLGLTVSHCRSHRNWRKDEVQAQAQWWWGSQENLTCVKLWGSVTDMMFAFVLVWNMMEYDRHVQLIYHILLVLILSRPKNFWIFVYLYDVNTQTSWRTDSKPETRTHKLLCTTYIYICNKIRSNWCIAKVP